MKSGELEKEFRVYIITFLYRNWQDSTSQNESIVSLYQTVHLPAWFRNALL